MNMTKTPRARATKRKQVREHMPRTYSLSVECVELLNDLSLRTGVKKSILVQRAIEHFAPTLNP